MPDLVATIFHLSDMHLFVDASGNPRNDPLPVSRFMIELGESIGRVPKLQALLSGIMWQNTSALHALVAELPEHVADELRDNPDAPVLVLQTGDVEALGSAAPAETIGYDAYPSWAFVHNALRAQAEDARASWIDIFGNHDTWPGAFPPMRVRHQAINQDRIATIPHLGGPWPGTVEVIPGTRGVPLVVARINTVSRTLLEETMASGAVSDHPPRGASSADVFNDLDAQLAPWRDRPAVRIVVLHHPPHPFDPTFLTELTTGWLEDRDELAKRLSDLRVQLVIAGHRHKLDPALSAEWVALPWQQPPLVDPTVQLVAESATQDSFDPNPDDTAYRERHPLSFCRYRLFTGADSLAVERTVYRYSELRGESFFEQPSGTLFEGLPLV